MDRIGTAVTEFFRQFPDEAACVRHILEARWGSHTPCPACGRIGRWTPIAGRRKFAHACRWQVTVTRGTVMHRSNLSLMAWFYAMLLMGNASVGMRSGFLRRQLGLGTRSTARLSNLIRLHMAACEATGPIGGPGKTVYVDEALVRYIAAKCRTPGTAPAIVMGFACEGRVLSGVIPDRKRSTILSAIHRHVRPGSTIVSDGHSSYKQLARLGWAHKTVNHAVFFSDFAGTTTNDIETYWRVLKRTLGGFRRVDARYFWLYLAEVQFRYNLRRDPDGAFAHLIRQFPEVAGERFGEIKAGFCW